MPTRSTSASSPTRRAIRIEDASANSGQKYLCVVNGTAAGGGYELALAGDHIMLVDDGSSTVSLPELPLLAVLPGTGGLTRVTDKRKVRRDHADVFCTTEEGVKGKRAVDWRLVDEVMPRSKLDESVEMRAKAIAAKQNGKPEKGIVLTPIERKRTADRNEYKFVSVAFERDNRLATVMLRTPDSAPPSSADEMVGQGAAFWPLQLARELDDAILDIRLNELEVATIVFKSDGDAQRVLAYDAFLDANAAHWLAREIQSQMETCTEARRHDVAQLVTLIEPGSCFAGTLAELIFAADRSYMLTGTMQGDNRAPAAILLGDANFSGVYPMSNGLSRLATRFLGEPESLDAAKAEIGKPLDAEAGGRARPRDLRARRHRLGGRSASLPRGARQFLARRADRNGSEPALRRPRDDGDEDLRAAHRLAELDLPAAECGRPRGRADTLRVRAETEFRFEEGVSFSPLPRERSEWWGGVGGGGPLCSLAPSPPSPRKRERE